MNFTEMKAKYPKRQFIGDNVTKVFEILDELSLFSSYLKGCRETIEKCEQMVRDAIDKASYGENYKQLNKLQLLKELFGDVK